MGYLSFPEQTEGEVDWGVGTEEGRGKYREERMEERLWLGCILMNKNFMLKESGF